MLTVHITTASDPRAAHNFTGAYSYVELVQGPASSTKADAMFTIGRDANNYYRIYVEQGCPDLPGKNSRHKAKSVHRRLQLDDASLLAYPSRTVDWKSGV